MFELLVNHFMGQIPVWVFPFMAGAGFALFIIAGIASHIQPVRIYALILRPVSFLVFVAGVFLYGGAGVIAVQEQALKEAQAKVDLAESQAKDANAQLAQALADKDHLIKGRSYGIKTVIQVKKEIIDRDCNKINSTAMDLYNRAVKNQATGAADASNIK